NRGVHGRPTVESPWPLRFDLMSARALVFIASAGRSAELTRDAHLFFFDRYQRLAQVHLAQGHRAASERLQARADEHERAGGGDPPHAAAMAMARPRRWVITTAIAGRPEDPDDAA